MRVRVRTETKGYLRPLSDGAPEGDDEGDGEFEDEAVEEGGH